jgi:hypothetical protein
VSDVDLTKLRAKFSGEEIGKLPRVICGACRDSRGGQCGDHKKSSCPVCKQYISERHIHIDFVGHADVTARLLDVDPEWQWAPRSTSPDPEMLRAAMATGDAAIVRAVIDNAPPRFERTANGIPVGLWITLTVGGITRPGVGSVPANQADAEKVLIGDALRNAAMRFGVALDLWAKGDRADPTAENATASASRSEQSRPARQVPEARVSRPAQQPEKAPETPDLGDWGISIDGIVTEEDGDRVDAELKAAYDAGKIPGPKATKIRQAIRAQVSKHEPVTA